MASFTVALKSWVASTFPTKANNLSDLASAATARENLGLGDSATKAVGITAGTVAAGDDSRITGAAQKASNLSDLASAAAARTNLGATAAGTALFAATDTAAQRDALGVERRYGSRWVFDGDSITIGSIVTNAAGQDRNGSWTTDLARRSMGRINYIYNAAAAGQNSTQCLARFDTYVTPYTPDVVLLTIGTNDVGASVERAVWLANLAAYLAKCETIGARLVVGAIWPTSDNTPAGRPATTRAWNDALREWAAGVGVDVIPWDELADPDTGGWPSGWSSDGIHPTATAAPLPRIAEFGWDWLQHRAGPATVQRGRVSAEGLLSNAFFTGLSAGCTATATSVTPAGTAGTLAAGEYQYRITPRNPQGENAVSYADCTHILGAPGGITLTRVISGTYNAWAIYRKAPGETTFSFMATVASGTATWTDDGTATAGHAWLGTNTSQEPTGITNGTPTSNMRTLAFGAPISTEDGVRGNVYLVARHTSGTTDPVLYFEVTGLTAGHRIRFSCLMRSSGLTYAQVILRWRSSSASITNTVVGKGLLDGAFGLVAVEATVPTGADRVRVGFELDDTADYLKVAELLLVDLDADI